MPQFTWEKILSKSYAQQKTMGRRMPFLRLTAGDGDVKVPFATYFKDKFFHGLVSWERQAVKGGKEKEVGKVTVRVSLPGESPVPRILRLDHAEHRADNHSAPTTHLYYDNATRFALEQTDYTGRTVRLSRLGDRVYLEVL